MTAIDFSRSHAVLVGTGRYTHGLEKMPQAINSLNAMQKMLVEVCGWPKSRVKVFADNSTDDKLDVQVTKLIHDTTDVLLFYYVGHGQLLDGGQLGLALSDTHRDGILRRRTSLRFNDMREEMSANRQARVKIAILDCCFSGLATKNTQGDDLAAQTELITKVAGAYTLTASQHWQKAHYDENSKSLTHFTGSLVDVVRTGLPGKGATLTLKDIHEGVTARLASVTLPSGEPPQRPSTLVVDTAEKLPFAANAAYVEPEAPSEGSVLSATPRATDAKTASASTEDADSEAAFRLFQRPLARLAGARLDVLSRAPVDRVRYVTMGGVLLSTASLAAISATFALNSIVGLGLPLSVVAGVLWGLAILNLDRLLVVTMTRKSWWIHRLITVFPRLILAIVLGAVISTPMLLKIFQPEIDNEMQSMHMERVAKVSSEILNIPPFTEIPSLEKEVDERLAVADRSTDQRAAETARQDARQARAKLDELRDRREKLLQESQDAEFGNSGLLARLEAFGNLGKSNSTLGAAQWFLFALFLTIEVLPVVVKILHLSGPPSIYDILVSKMEAEASGATEP
ncbi:caspase, EACC1-associated type [Amycolatopsis sp. NPDC003861]